MPLGTKDLITEDNVSRTYTEGKYICFVLKNGFTIKLNPNEETKGEKDNVGHKG